MVIDRMQQLRKRWILILAAILLGAAWIGWHRWRLVLPATGAALYAPVRQGTFKILVTTTGELRSSKFVQISGPAQAQEVGVFQTKISSIIPEGSVVKAGDVVAELDRAPLATHQNDVLLNLQKARAEFTTAELDSALTLAQAREDVRNAEYDVEEKKLAKEQQQYEAPSIKRQADIDYEKAERALDQARHNLTTKTKQAIAKMSSSGADLARQQNELKNIQAVMESFTVRAPAPGMVIYFRSWDGSKKGVGSQWNAWNPVVATLPDLTQMESDTYVNEVDVRKIALGQKVQVALDADPTKHLVGTVTGIANVGEQRPNQDSKVFTVKIAIGQPDTTLRPGMTTANAIETASIPNALFIPLEAVVNEGGFAYVYKNDGGTIVKQMIETGPANDDDIIVRRGLTKDDRVMLTVPVDKLGIQTRIVPGLKPLTGSTDSTSSKR